MAEKKQTPAAGSKRELVKVERPVLVEFNSIGVTAKGTLIGITNGITTFGEAEFLQLRQDDGKKASVCISSSMALIDWEELQGLYVEIEYTGDEKSKKNKGKTFKTFEVRHEPIPAAAE